MKYVKIVSKSVTTPEDMFTLGVSTSRGKENKIGQFGSGTLLGTLAWMRVYGTSPVFMINGKKVVFETKDVLKSDGEPFKQVLMCHSRKKAPLSVALEYGTLDWPTACLGLREWISNAIDGSAEGTDPKTLIVLTNKIEASDDEVAVFVPYVDLRRNTSTTSENTSCTSWARMGTKSSRKMQCRNAGSIGRESSFVNSRKIHYMITTCCSTSTNAELVVRTP